MDRGAWWAAVYGVAKSQTWLRDFPFTFHFHSLEKEMATHSSVLAWRIPAMGEPGGLPSMGSHRVGHDWSDLAAASDVPKAISSLVAKQSPVSGFSEGKLLAPSVVWWVSSDQKWNKITESKWSWSALLHLILPPQSSALHVTFSWIARECVPLWGIRCRSVFMSHSY